MAFSRGELISRNLVHGDAARGEVIGRIELHRIARQIEILRELKILDRPLTAEAVATKEFLPATRR
jgi:hypothetical protein